MTQDGRRDFLKVLGLGALGGGAATLIPITKAEAEEKAQVPEMTLVSKVQRNLGQARRFDFYSDVQQEWELTMHTEVWDVPKLGRVIKVWVEAGGEQQLTSQEQSMIQHALKLDAAKKWNRG